MTRTKKIILGIAIVILLPVLILGAGLALFFGAFNSIEPPPHESKDLGGGVTLVPDDTAVSYLLTSSREAVLVDCGNDTNGKAILEELKKWSLGADDVKAIFLTHGHPDHIASCHLFTKAEVYAFAADVPLAAGEVRAKGPLTRFLDPPPVEKRIKVSKTLTDGEVITVGDRQVTVFAVPGHTGGSASYLSGGVLMMGDSANLGKDGKLRPSIWFLSDDQDQDRKSLHALAMKLDSRKEEVRLIAYGHSNTSEGLKALLSFKP